MHIESLLDLIKKIGLSKSIFFIVILSCHFYVLSWYKNRLKDRQSEINRLAKENYQYREIFLKLVDNKFK
jgi:hypothetical protein